MEKEKYWEERALREYKYKDEAFYTITPVPYYYARRKIILNYLDKIITKSKSRTICDFGCGDGEYINKLYKDSRIFYGVDASENMIKLAKRNTKGKNVEFGVSSTGISGDGIYDIVYSSAVWAHINDHDMSSLLDDISKKIKPEGGFVLCEQCAPYRYERSTYMRRTYSEYKKMLEVHGLHPVFCTRIDFWAHRILFERNIAKKFYAKEKARTNIEDDLVKIICNRKKSFQIVSKIFTAISIPNKFRRNLDGWGYIFIYAIKK